MKQIAIHFEFPDGTREQYESVWEDLRSSGNEHPKGLLFHVAAKSNNGGVFVTDVWESEEAFKEFGNILIPSIQKSGLPMADPQIMELYNVYESKHELA